MDERKTFDWRGGRAAGVPLGVGQRKQRIACRYKEVLWTEWNYSSFYIFFHVIWS